MELELGLKITKTKDDIDSISEYQLMKDAGPVFHSRETHTMFILIANLKGYKRNNIDIKISKDGSKISIIGKKPIQEMVMMGWVMQRKVVDVKGFNKVFKIPHGVSLDKIKANYNEEEWMMNIIMPKLVKGICGLKIEEFKEQEKSEIDNVSSSVGETSQKGSKDCEFQHMEGSENAIEKMLDDTKKEVNKDIITQEEVRGSNLIIQDGNDEVNRNIIGGTIKEEEKEESNLRSKDSKVKDIDKGISHNITEISQRVFEESMIQQSGESKQNVSKEHFEESEKENSMEPFEAIEVLEVEHNVIGHIPGKIGCINKNEFEESSIPQMEKNTNTKGKIIGGEYEKLPFEENQDFQKEMIKPKMKIKDGDQECVLEKLGGKERFDDGMMIIKKDILKNIPKSTSKESGGLNVENMQETKNVKEEMVSKEVEYFAEKGEGERIEMMHVEEKKGNNTRKMMQEEIEEKRKTIKGSCQEQFSGIEGNKEFNFENKDEQKEVIKKTLVENESLTMEGGEYKERTKEICQDVEDTTEYGIVKLKEDGFIKMGENGLMESGHEKSAGIEGSKGFNFANEEQNEVINDALIEDESLTMEGSEYKEKTKEIVQYEEDKNKHGMVKLKGEGCTKINGEPNEPFEAENVNIGIFDGRKTQKFQKIEQTEVEDVNEEGENIEKSKKKVIRDKYEKVKNEENEGSDKNKTKKIDERFSQEETSKGISKASNASKEVFPDKMSDSFVDTREGRKNTMIEKTKGIKESAKESSMGLFEALNVSKLEPFEANDDDHKNFIKPKMETKDDEPKGKKPNKEGFDAKITINEEFPKNIPTSTHEESEGLNNLKMQETKDVKEYVVKRKGKEIEYFKEKDEGDRLKMMDVEAKKVSNTKETMKEEIEKIENGIEGGGQQQVAKIEGSKGFKVEKEQQEEESKKISKSKEQDEESISHNIIDSGQRVFEEALIQQSGESKQKEIGGSKCDSKERLKEVLKESSLEQNEFREPRVPQMEKSKSTKGRKNGGMDSEKKPFKLSDVQKAMFGDTIQKEVIKINEQFPKSLPESSFNENEGLNVQKIQESKNVKEEMVDKEIEYFKEKGESEIFKRMHVKTKKGNTKETMYDEVKKNGNEFNASGQQHAKENTIKEMNEVSKNVTKELKQKVGEIYESREFNDAKEEEQIKVIKKSLVKSESLIKKVEGNESKERAKAKRVQDGDDKIEFGIVNLKVEGPRKIHVDGRSFQEKEESKDVDEKGENPEKLGNIVNKIQNQEDGDFKKCVTEEKDECYLLDGVSERKYQDTKNAKEDIPMKMVDSQKEELNDRKIEKRKSLEVNEKVVSFEKKVRFEKENFKERTKEMDVDDEEVINDYGIVKLKGEGSTKIMPKFQENEEIEDVNEKVEKSGEFVNKVNEKIQNEKDEGFKKNTKIERDECFLQEMSEGRPKASKATNEKENRHKKVGPLDVLIKKENVGIGIIDGRKIQKFQEMNQTQDVKKKGASNEKTMKKMNGNKYKTIQNEESEGFKNKITNEKDECYLDGEMSKGISQESMDAKEDMFPMMLDSPANSEEGLNGRKTEKTKGVKEECEKVEQVEENEGLRNDMDESNFGESMTKEELQELRNFEREFQSVVSMGFKEFDYENAKDKKQKTKALDTTFESRERYESRDESMNREVGENRTRNKVGETLQEKTDEPKKKIDDREQENATTDDANVETKEKYRLKEYKTTQNIDEKCKIDAEIAKSSIRKDDKKKRILETMKTTQEKECLVKFEVGEKEEEEESLDERLKNDIAEMMTNRDYEQHEYGEEEIKAPKTTTYEEAKPLKLQKKRVNQQSKDEINRKSECVIEEHEATKEFSPKNVEKGKVVKKREGLKVANKEETKDNSTLTTPQTIEEKKSKMKEKTSQFDKASGSKRVEEKVHETPEEVAQQSKVPSSLSTQQLEVEAEEKTKKKEVEQCKNKGEEANHEIEEKDYEKVHEEEKEGEAEPCEEKNNNAKISKKLLVPLVIAGSTILATVAFIFIKYRRSRKM